MRLTRGECVTVALFYPPATPANINACVRNMARATRFLVGKNRKRVQRLLRLTRSPAIEDQLMPEHGDDRWLWMDSEMLVLYNRASSAIPDCSASWTSTCAPASLWGRILPRPSAKI